MSQKHSRAGRILLGAICGGILGFILALFVCFLPIGNRIANSFNGLNAGFLILLVYFPASTLIGAITGALIVAWRLRDRG